MKKILVTYQLPHEGFKNLKSKFEITFPTGQSFSKTELISTIGDYDGLIACNVSIDRDVLEAAKKLKIISTFGVGYDNVDVETATKKEILVANTPKAVTEATAETAFGLMLAVMRRISEWDRKLRNKDGEAWDMLNNMGHTLYGKTLGIIGMGRIGQAMARRGIASGMKIVYYSRNRLDPEREKVYGADYLPLPEVLKNSDVLSIHVPFTKDTFHMLGEAEFKLMKPSAYIINTARGAVMDEKVLIEYLTHHRIGGAGMDVFETEPSIPEELLKLDNVVLTPHIGTGTVESRTWIALEASQNIFGYFRGQRGENIINP